ncbi:uncharacterized protein LOC135848972 [Planococcus citri]|uniref:uncharacterized protein LOC135848972 n=1 Tax=Planococcus citri TaxID=170843 RepID=UPI0031F8CD27
MSKATRKTKSNTKRNNINPSSQIPETRSRKNMPSSKKAKIVEETDIPHSSFDFQSCPSSSTTDQDTSIVGIMNTSKQDFAGIRFMEGFVDKTLLISTVLSCSSSYILLLAPRCCGKSVNITMLKRYFEIPRDEKEKILNHRVFEKTLISKDTKFMKKHFGNYPVLYLNFKSSGSVCSFEIAFKFVREVVKKAYVDHSEVLLASKKLISSEKKVIKDWFHISNYVKKAVDHPDIYFALENLARFLVQHHGRKIFLFVDDYDGICTDAMIHMEDRIIETTGAVLYKADHELKNTIAFCQGALSCLLKPSQRDEFVDRAVLTGTSEITTMGLNKLRTVKQFRFQEKHTFSKLCDLTPV